MRSTEGGMRCRHYRGEKTEGGCHSCSPSVIPAPLLSFLRRQESRVVLLTNEGKGKDTGSSITNVEDDRRGGGEDDRRRKARMTEGEKRG